MLSIQEKVLVYYDLPADEQAELMEEIGRSPELRALFAEAQALQGVLAAVQPADFPSAEDLAEYILVPAMNVQEPPTEVAARFASIEASLATDDALVKQLDEIRSSILRLTTDLEDPLVRFEQLTVQARIPESSSPVDHRHAAPKHGMRIVRTVRFALAACLGLAAVYGALAIVSWQLQPERARLASLETTEEAFYDPVFRGDAAVGVAEDDLDRALNQLREARTTTLGLFPRFDERSLEAAADLATRFLVADEEGSLRNLRAHYLLGRIRLYQGREDEAAESLEQVVSGRGEGAEDARRLLDFVRAGSD